jgi:thymidylate synthase (FAD)
MTHDTYPGDTPSTIKDLREEVEALRKELDKPLVIHTDAEAQPLKKHNTLREPFEFLDHGYVKYIDHMGTDEGIVRCARLSYDNLDAPQDEAKTKSLINYLLEHAHTSPFEMCELQVEIQAPLFVVQQLIRHRTASLNQLSMRYTQPPEQAYRPDSDRFAPQDSENKQGTQEVPLGAAEAATASAAVDLAYKATEASYAYMKHLDVSNEVARTVIPQGQYTRLVWKMDLHNLLHFLKLRTDPHAQWEIQQLAIQLETIVAELWPITYNAWLEFQKKAIKLSKTEREMLLMFLSAVEEETGINLVDFAHELGMPKSILGSKRRGRRFMQKLGLNKDTE